MELKESGEIGAAMTCPLTGELMRDPVIDADGNSFERANILVWLKDRGRSPITNRVMTKDELRPNTILRETIERKREEARRQKALEDASHGWQYDKDPDLSGIPVDVNTETTVSKEKPRSSLLRWLSGGSSSSASGTKEATASSTRSFADVEKEAATRRREQNELEKKRAKKKKAQRQGVQFAMDRQSIAPGGSIEQLHDLDSAVGSSESGSSSLGTGEQNRSHGLSSETDNLVSAPFEGVKSRSADARQRAPAPPSSDGGGDGHMGLSVESREEEKEKGKEKEKERMKTKKKKKAMITDPVDISDNASVASHVSSVSEASERERMKVAKRRKMKKAEKAFVGEGSGGSRYGATVSLSADSGPSRGDSRRGRWRSSGTGTGTGTGAGAGADADMSPPRSLSPFDLPGELELSQRDVCTSTVGWLLTVLCCPLPRLPPSDRPLAQHNLLRYWNLHISAPEVINASLLSPFWWRALRCLTLAHGDACRGCGGSGDGSYVSDQGHTRDSEALFSSEAGEGTRGYGTGTPPTPQPRQTQAQGRGNPGGGRITPGGKVSREDVQRTPNNSHQAAPSALRGGARESSLFYVVSSLLSSAEDNHGYASSGVKEEEGEGEERGEEETELQVDLLVEALRGLALAWLHLLTVTALLCWSADGFSMWLRNTLSSGTLLTRVLLRLVLPTAGSAPAVLQETSLYIESAQSSVSVSVGSDGGSGGIASLSEDNVPSLQAMLSLMSLADGLPLALLLFTTGYAALRAYRYTVLARAEVVRQAHKKSALAFASAYLDARAVDSKQVEEAKVTGVDSDEEDGSVATITYKGQRITLPRDVAETADLESLGASISPPPPNQQQHHQQHQHHHHQQHQHHQQLQLQKGRAAGGTLSSGGGGGAGGAAGAASRGIEPPLPLSYRHTDLLGMALAAAAPTYYALLVLSLLFLIGGTSGSALGPFSSLYWRDCGATWWAAVVPLPLSNLVPLFTSSSSSLLAQLESLYTAAVDSAVTSLSSTGEQAWSLGYELSPLLLDRALHAALAGAHLAAGLCAQVGALALATVAGLCYAEKAFLSVLGLRVPSSRETSPMAERSGPGMGMGMGMGMGGLPRRVIGHVSFWRAALACAVVLVLAIRALAASTVISATGAQAQLLGVDASMAWPDSTLAPLSTNSIFLARVVYAPWCRLDAAALGILFYLVSVPGGLSLRNTQASSTAGSGSGSDSGSGRVVDGAGRARSYRAALLLSYGAFEGPYNSPDASRSGEFNRSPSHKAPFGQDSLIDTVLGLHSTSADSDDEEDRTPGTLTSLLAERDRERALLLSPPAGQAADGATPPNKVSASAASMGPQSVHPTGGEADDSTIGTFATGTTTPSTTPLDEAWYTRDPYSLGDGYQVRRVDVAPAERLSGVSREDLLVGRRAGISAPKGVRFAHPGGRGRGSIHGGMGGDAEAEVDSWGRDGGGGGSRSFVASISRGLSAALGWVSGIATGSEYRRGYGFGDDDTDDDDDDDDDDDYDEEVGLLGRGRGRGRGRADRGGSYTAGEQHRKKQGQQHRTRLLAIEILLARERRALLLARLGKVLVSTTLLVLTAAHFMSTQESSWFQWILRVLRVASRDEVAHSLSAEFAFRFLSQCLAPVAALCLAHLASSPGWHNPAHYLLCHVLIRNPLFTLLGRLSVPFLLFHPLVAAVTLRSGLLVPSTLTSTGVSSGTTITTTTYAYTWGSNGVPSLFCLYVATLAAAAAVSLVVALLVERPLWRYCKDNLMERFGVARQFRELL